MNFTNGIILVMFAFSVAINQDAIGPNNSTSGDYLKEPTPASYFDYDLSAEVNTPQDSTTSPLFPISEYPTAYMTSHPNHTATYDLNPVGSISTSNKTRIISSSVLSSPAANLAGAVSPYLNTSTTNYAVASQTSNHNKNKHVPVTIFHQVLDSGFLKPVSEKLSKFQELLQLAHHPNYGGLGLVNLNPQETWERWQAVKQQWGNVAQGWKEKWNKHKDYPFAYRKL